MQASYESILCYSLKSFSNMRRCVSYEHTPDLSPHLYEDTPLLDFKTKRFERSIWRHPGKKLFSNSVESEAFSELEIDLYETIQNSDGIGSVPNLYSQREYIEKLPIASISPESVCSSKDSAYVSKRDTDIETSSLDDPPKNVENKPKKISQDLYLEQYKIAMQLEQASNLLKSMKKQKIKQRMAKELLVERILVESDVKYTKIDDLIKSSIYESEPFNKSRHQGTISLSKFHFPLKSKPIKLVKNEFYMLVVSVGNNIQFSKTVQAFEDFLDFGETFVFKNLDASFEVNIQVYCIRMTKRNKGFRYFFRKKPKTVFIENNIEVLDPTTNNTKILTVLKSSFQLVAEVTLDKTNIGDKPPHVLDFTHSSRLQSKASFSFKVENITIDCRLTGFLNLGQKIEDRMFWEKKWCVLRETQLKIFNYPSYEDFVEPVHCINLIYSQGNCTQTINGRRKSFLLKIARPSTVEESSVDTLKTRPNFVVETFYFNADSVRDFQRWYDEVKAVIESLIDWKKIVDVNLV